METPLTRDNAKARVHVIYTGGTIGMVPSEPGNMLSPLVPATKENLQQVVPGLGEVEGIYWDIDGLIDNAGNPVPPLDSSDLDATHWSYMAAAIERRYPDYDGFVILHGTDTMAYTASALSFMLQNLAKPVVLTGAQLPIFNPRTDAIQNLVNALHLAGYKATGLPLIAEVILCFGDSILRGNRVRKMSSVSWQGFDTPNSMRLGVIGEHIRINQEFLRPPVDNREAPFFVHKNLITDVIDIGIFPGLRPSQLEQVLDLPGLRGVVLRTFGAGNAPNNQDFLSVIARAVQTGKVIVNVTQCPQGMVEMGLYSASNELLERGVISGMDMTAEAALTKLMWILATEAGDEVQTQLQIDQRGEQTGNLFDIRFGACGNRSEPQALVQVAARPPGQFRRARLTKAVLRLSGFGCEGRAEAEMVGLRAFINLPSADNGTPLDDAHFAGMLTQSSLTSEPAALIADVTSTVRRVVEEGRPIYVTLVPPKDVRFWCKGLFLALFA